MRPGRRSAGKALGVVLVCLLVVVPLVAAVGPAMGAEGIVVGRPILDVYAPDNRVVGGEQVSLDVFVSNAGEITRGGPAQYEERVTTARNVRIDFLEEEFPDELAANVEVLTGTVPAGVVPQGTAGPFEIRLEIDEGIEPGTYDVPAELAYDYTWAVRYSDLREPEFRDASREDRETLTLVVRDRPRFEVTSDGPVVTAGDTAVRTFTVTNVGSDPATNASLALAADESPLSLGSGSGRPGGGTGGVGGATARVSLGDLAPGESGTATVRVGAPADLPPGGYPLTATVEYRSAAGIVEQSRPVSVSVPVGAEQTFAVTDVTDTLQVGETGTVSGTVTNTGDKTVSNAVVVFPVNATGLQPRAREYAVGTLEPGESATFEFAVDTPNGTTAGPRVLPFTVRYRNAGDDVRVSSPVDAPVTVAGEQTFDVRNVESDLQVGASGTLTGTVVNTGDRPVSGAVVVFGGSDGIQPRETRYPVGTLDPGETAEFRFPAEVAPTVEAGPQFVTFRVRYRGGDDRIRQSAAIDATVQIGPEQTFAVRNVTSTLQAGETGTVTGTVVNTGTQAVTDAAVVFATNGTSIQPRNREVAVGTLEPGASAPFSFTADVPRTAGSGPRPLLFQVRYRDVDDELRTSDPVPAGVEVAREQTFAIEDATSTLRAGERGRVVATLRNTGTATTEDVRLVYTGEGPLQPLANEAAAGTLAPDETAQVSFTFDVPRDADPGRRSLPFVVQYRGRDDETRTTSPLSVATTIAEEQTFALENATSTLQVDDTGTVTAELVNTGDVAAEGIVVVVQETGPMLVPRETEYAVDSLAPGERAPVEFRFDATADAEPGPRLLTFRVRYRGQRDQVRTTDDIDVTVGVSAEQSFAVGNVTSTLRAGERGRVEATLRNTGAATAEDVRLVYTGEGPLQPLASEAAAGTLGAGESRRVSFTFDVPRDADPGRRLLPFVVQYRGRDDEVRTTAPLSVETTVADEQTFALDNLTSTLQVDDTGAVTAEVVNTGDVAARGVVVLVQETGPTLVPREVEYAVGPLAPGERAPVEFRFDVTADAEPGPRLLTFQVRYRGQRNQVQTTDDIDATVGIEPQRDEFVVAAVNATVPAGEAEIVTLRVHNLENETLRDVRARLFVDDPLTSANSEAFVSTLGPNETATLRFEVSAGAGAVAKEYPLLVDFTYEDESGESVLSDTYFVPLDVVAPTSREFPVPIPVVLVIVALVVIGVLLYWQRERVTTALGRE